PHVLFGGGLGAMVVMCEARPRATSPSRVLGALIGGTIGLALARAVEAGLFFADNGDRQIEFLHSFLLIALPYLGLAIGAKNGEWLQPARLVSLFQTTGPLRRYKILDTSVIIDGRIADVCETGVVDGTLAIPQ